MSTSYYYCAEGITSVRLEQGEVHDKVTVWQNHGNAGTLTVEAGFGPRLCSLLSERDMDDLHCPMRTHFGGKDVGCVVTENVRGLDPALCLIDEYGIPTTVAAVRAFSGRGRAT